MKRKRDKSKKGSDFLDVYKGVRKPMTPPTRVIDPNKKKYDRKNKDWMKD